MMAIRVGRMMLLFLVSSWIIIHLGMNPDRGGRPPMDSKVIRISVVIRGILFHVCESDSVVVEELWINRMNIVSVIIM